MGNSFENKKVLVLGLGKSGLAAASLLIFLRAEVYTVDDASWQNQSISNELSLKKIPLLSSTEACEGMKQFEIIVVSPGIPATHPCYLAAQACNKLIIGEVELAANFLVGRTCIGVTGTNGKSTVTLFLQHLLQQEGLSALGVGNLGIPLCAVAEAICKEQVLTVLPNCRSLNGYTHLIIELSSFQLETMNTHFLDMALLLNVTEDHLDRYANFEDYAKAKFRIFSCLKPDGKGFIESKASEDFSILAPNEAKTYGYNLSNHIYTDGHSINYNENPEILLPLPLRYSQNHDLENFMACYAIGRTLGLTPESIVSAFFSFKKPPHRIEFVAELNGVTFIDDSKGTNIDAVCRAVASIQGNIILIAGGVDKGASYVPWIKQFAGKVRCICAIGQAAAKIEQELSGAIQIWRFDNLTSAVLYAQEIAGKGETVLLSPGCASYDLFTDYAHRGREFKKIVNQLREQQ